MKTTVYNSLSLANKTKIPYRLRSNVNRIQFHFRFYKTVLKSGINLSSTKLNQLNLIQTHYNKYFSTTLNTIVTCLHGLVVSCILDVGCILKSVYTCTWSISIQHSGVRRPVVYVDTYWSIPQSSLYHRGNQEISCSIRTGDRRSCKRSTVVASQINI